MASPFKLDTFDNIIANVKSVTKHNIWDALLDKIPKNTNNNALLHKRNQH